MENDKKIQIKHILAVVLFFTFTLVFYGPVSIFLPNAEEIWFGIGELMKIVLPVSLACFIALSLVLILLRKTAGSFLLKLLFGFSLAVYIQGNFINISYGTGVMDGSEIDWSRYTVYAVIDTLVWVVCIALPFILSKLESIKPSIKSTSIIMLMSLFLTAVQLPAMVSQFITYVPNSNTELKVTDDKIFDLSGDNIIIIILDAMDEDYYEDYIKQHPDYIDGLNGFVLYSNTLASGSRTMVGVPSMFTGKPFRRENTYSEYLDKVWGEKNSISVLVDNGYTASVYADPMTYSSKAADYVDNFVLDGPEASSHKTLLKKIYKMDLFKFSPHLLKKKFWFNTSDFNEARDNGDTYSVYDPYFYSAFKEEGFSVNEDMGKRFILYHLNGAHQPYSMNEEMEESADATFESQVVGSFKGVEMMLDDIREKGVYDSSMIIITGDHGDVDMGDHPLFMVKMKGDNGEYRESALPVSLFDLPVLLADQVNEKLDGQEYGLHLSDLNEGDIRERHFFYNTTGNSRLSIKEFITSSYAGDRGALLETNSFEDSCGPDTPYEFGTVLSFRKDATGNRYTVEGFSQNTGYRTLLRGPVTRLEIPLADIDDAKSLDVHFGVHSVNTEGIMDIVVNNETIDSVTVSSSLVKEGINFEVPTDIIGEDRMLNIEFRFHEISESEMEKEVDYRTLTISLTELMIEAGN